MKKVIRLLGIIMIMALMASGCSKNDEKKEGSADKTDTPKVTEAVTATEIPTVTDIPSVTDEPKVTDTPTVTDIPVVTDEPVVTDTPEITDTPDITDSPEITDAPVLTLTPEEVVGVYEEFLSGKREAVSITDAGMLEEGRSYFLEDIFNSFGSQLEKEMLPSVLSDKKKAYIDCGMDGYPELAVQMSFERADGYDSPDVEYIVLRLNGEELDIVTNFSEYYRSFATLNEYGFITIGGSSGALSYSCTNSFINADGKEEFLWSESDHFGFSKPYFSTESYEIPDDLKEILAKDVEYAEGGNSYEMNRVCFVEYEDTLAEGEEWEKHYKEYLLKGYYTFVDADGNNGVTDEEYISLCNENGVKLMTLEELDQMRADRAWELGCTSEIVSGEMPSWEDFDVESETEGDPEAGVDGEGTEDGEIEPVTE